MKGELRIATRRSRLALWQAEHVAARLAAFHPGLVVSLVPIVTEGDRIKDRSLATAGGKGLFIKELENALQEGRADLAVHSMKDMPAALAPGFAIASALERGDARDCFVSSQYASLDGLPRGARVGTSSLRRQCQLRHRRPDLEIVVLRGNVDTRLAKLDAGACDATVLAAAGLERLGLESRIRARLSTRDMLPAIGQGIVGVECLAERDDLAALLEPLEHAPTRAMLRAERALAAALGASCTSPIAGHATLSGDVLRLEGLAGSPDGRSIVADAVEGTAREGEALGAALATRLLAAGAGDLL
ncbi:MAG TPA: hydroxymethylbilane synthase [Steroidobacteraceae bacterium]|nr:hydroxymethylbilane synthase [Steroidobacteraceae bacterium]